LDLLRHAVLLGLVSLPSADNHHPAYAAPSDLWAPEAPAAAARYGDLAARRPCERCAWARWSRATASASSATAHTPSKGIDAVVPMPFFFIQRAPASLLEPELLVRRDVDPNPPREKHEPREAARHGECRGGAVSVEHGGEAEPEGRRCRNARALQPD
jgi:hypothetical protein